MARPEWDVISEKLASLPFIVRPEVRTVQDVVYNEFLFGVRVPIFTGQDQVEAVRVWLGR